MKAKSAAKGAVVAASDVNARATTVAASDGKKGTTRPLRFPISGMALAGVLIAGGYGHFVLGMRLGPPMVMVALGGMTLALCAAALWRVIDPLTRADVAAAATVRAPHRLRELEREKQAVLKAIKEIELDYQMRKISETDYREMVERYRTRALRVMGDLATGDDYKTLIERELKARVAARAAVAAAGGERSSDTPSTSGGAPRADVATVPAAPPAGCARCGASNDADARFCKKCGNLLLVSPDPA